ncbi:endonuclease domain-containing protein [Herbiconiux sp. CPCC 205716]|uniref:Endonuclease domain-containing protein n=1 Tax=Herbiconiux gentiana TaxID=2970912 RepID=A0ABT2GKF0_9MICO|nr:endonuclease domain-containing protein [Herbiconiux gentiana]MCS5715246.1 endonuclease domain-containing protein [Herbiconiux gentiana]
MVRHVPLPAELSERAFGVGDGAAAGLSEKRMRGSDLERPYHGVRRRPVSRPSVLQRCRSYAVRMPEGQVFSHTTAALLWGLPLPPAHATDARLHVTASGGGSRPRTAGIVGHEGDGVGTSIRSIDELRVVDPMTAWVQLAVMLPLDDLVAAADHLVLTPRRQAVAQTRPFCSRDELAERLELHCGRGKASAVRALALVRDGAESPRETHLRLALVRHGLPEPELNVSIEDARGLRIGYGDLVYPEWKVLVEYDGEQHRSDSRQYYRDVERLEALHRAGWHVVRATKETPRIGLRSAPVRAEHALRSRSWRPAS